MTKKVTYHMITKITYKRHIFETVDCIDEMQHFFHMLHMNVLLILKCIIFVVFIEPIYERFAI